MNNAPFTLPSATIVNANPKVKLKILRRPLNKLALEFGEKENGDPYLSRHRC